MKNLCLLACLAVAVVAHADPDRLSLSNSPVVPQPVVIQAPALTTIQTIVSRLSGTYSFDLDAKVNGKRRIVPTPAALYRSTSYTNVLGKGINLDLDGILGVSAGTPTLGIGIIYAKSFAFTFSNEVKGSASFVLGPSLLSTVKGQHLGLVTGIGFNF